jgi:carbamoyltransferase
MNIVGLNFFHADTSSAIIVDNQLIAAAEEERFSRIKHFSGFPVKSLDFCLKEAGIKINDIDLYLRKYKSLL